ncbi:unnamed protein product [Cylindrotheca closterium]|uniref:Uncharacterized protein n=1 Tax=Cylindrotheca closterium TaxID=2856 RepID=A0AAD2CXW5_9STRA|nr:unnamed protein product [Cylindrotheca closterium]
MTTSTDKSTEDSCLAPKVMIATRLHLGKATSPPTAEKLASLVTSFGQMAEAVENSIPVIAVDSTSKIEGYDYPTAIRQALATTAGTSKIQILPVTPWGKFTPALNALVTYAVEVDCGLIMFCSAEIKAPKEAIEKLCRHVDIDTLVAGAALPGHLYSPGTQDLSGRTCPWNTLAVWDVKKLSLTGFQLCSDLGATAGVEECAVVGLLQKLFVVPATTMMAKLVKLDEIQWEQEFEDEERRKWHEYKMKSKLDRAQAQMEQLNLASSGGKVLHC